MPAPHLNMKPGQQDTTGRGDCVLLTTTRDRGRNPVAVKESDRRPPHLPRD